MARPITNLLTQGLPSRIYLLCFLKPKSGYALAKAIYGGPTTAKIYVWTNEMVKKDYLRKEKHGYHAVVTPLINEIQRVLNEHNTPLEFREKRLLSLLLKSDGFRSICCTYYDNISKEEKQKLDVLSLMVDILPLLSSIAHNTKLLTGLPDMSLKESLKIFENEKQVIAHKLSNKDVSSEVSDLVQIMNSYRSTLGEADKISEKYSDVQLAQYVNYSLIQDLPNAFLKKLAKLSPIGEYITDIFAMAISLLVLNAKHELMKDPEMLKRILEDK